MKRLITLIFLNFSIAQCQGVYYPNFDFKLFQNTQIVELAKAVERQDTLKIEMLVKRENKNINYLEPKFGKSLLELALINERQLSVEKLLELGADPNIRSPKDNSTPILSFCQYAGTNLLAKPSMFRLLIKYKADVNSEQIWLKADSSSMTPQIKKTALQFLCTSGTLELVKILVENGARLDKYTESGRGSIFLDAILNPKLDIFHYLLIEKQIPIPDYIYIINRGSKGEKKFGLRYLITKRDSMPKRMDLNQLQLEREILAYLKAHGQ
jgi:ankyrin repeat protein